MTLEYLPIHCRREGILTGSMIFCASLIASRAVASDDSPSFEQNVDRRSTVTLRVVEAFPSEKSLKILLRHASENLAPGGVSSELFEGVGGDRKETASCASIACASII